MAPFWILSDLHADQSFWLRLSTPDWVDVIVAAGDIDGPASCSVKRLAALADGLPVVFVPGNHEWYATGIHFGVDGEAERAREKAEELGVRLLMDDEVQIAGVRFLSSTLRTDFALHSTPEASMAYAARAMNDFAPVHSPVRRATLRSSPWGSIRRPD